MNAIIIDDEVISVKSVEKRVEWKKYGIKKVFTANSCDQARIIFRKEKIEIMLCDIEMPQELGLELLKWVNIESPETKCIFLTCHPEFSYVREALQLGSRDYILKPIDYQELDQVMIKTVTYIKEEKERKELREYGKVFIKNMIDELGQKKEESPVDKVKRYIIEHISDNLNINEIANEVYLNPQYLMRIFKKEMNMSILEYIVDERICFAKELLINTELPIYMIADAVGYGNYSYFNKLFKRITGNTPKEYRLKTRKS